MEGLSLLISCFTHNIDIQMHLFDINIPGKIKFQESETLSSGDRLSTFQLGDFCQVGLGICYDIRFAELAQLYARQGSFFIYSLLLFTTS